MSAITYGVSTELDAVNSILMSVGESPVNTLTVQSPEVAIAQKTLRQVCREIQAEGWSYNTENEYPIDLDTVDPGKTGDFVSEDIETATTVTGNNYGPRQNYGAASNFANTCGLIFQREAAGVVETIGPQVQVTSGDVSVVYQGDVILGRLAMGADYVNPAACVELFAGTTTKPSAFS